MYCLDKSLTYDEQRQVVFDYVFSVVSFVWRFIAVLYQAVDNARVDLLMEYLWYEI